MVRHLFFVHNIHFFISVIQYIKKMLKNILKILELCFA